MSRRPRYGRSDFLTSLDADRSLAAAGSALAASESRLAAEQIKPFLALGGGWEQEAESPHAGMPTKSTGERP